VILLKFHGKFDMCNSGPVNLVRKRSFKQNDRPIILNSSLNSVSLLKVKGYQKMVSFFLADGIIRG